MFFLQFFFYFSIDFLFARQTLQKLDDKKGLNQEQTSDDDDDKNDDEKKKKIPIILKYLLYL